MSLSSLLLSSATDDSCDNLEGGPNGDIIVRLSRALTIARCRGENDVADELHRVRAARLAELEQLVRNDELPIWHSRLDTASSSNV